MAKLFLIWFVACMFVTCLCQTSEELELLNKKVKKNIRKRRALGKEVVEIWAKIETENAAQKQAISELQNDVEEMKMDITMLKAALSSTTAPPTQTKSTSTTSASPTTAPQTTAPPTTAPPTTAPPTTAPPTTAPPTTAAPTTAAPTTAPPTTAAPTTAARTIAPPTTEAPTIASPCDLSWNSSNGHCYLVVQERKTWNAASAYCVDRSGYLTEILTKPEYNFALELIQSTDQLSIWVGAKYSESDGKFIYPESNDLVPEEFWRDGQPSMIEDGRHCAAMLGHSSINGFGSALCDGTAYFICETTARTTTAAPTTAAPTTAASTTPTPTPTPTTPLTCDKGWQLYNQHCYLLVEEVKTWDDAKVYCEDMEGYLMEILTQADYNVSVKLLSSIGGGNIWIGANDRGEEVNIFRYAHSNALVPEEFWRADEPNNGGDSGTTHDCVVMLWYRVPIPGLTSNGLGDALCDANAKFVCQKP